MTTELDQTPSRSKKEMTSTAKYLNIAIQLVLLIIVAYIVTSTVNTVGIVLFTWHPVFASIGVSRKIIGIDSETT
jgi:steroid 5-alpha reductase family enzyme